MNRKAIRIIEWTPVISQQIGAFSLKFDCYQSVVVFYAHTNQAHGKKGDELVMDLQKIRDKVLRHDNMLIIIGNLNAQVV